MQFIKRSEAVKQIRTGETFTMEFVTADMKRGTGGDLIEVVDWQITGADDDDFEAGGPPGTGGGSTRCPNHDDHGTVNIHNPGNKQAHIISVHIDLIQTFNGKLILNG